MTDYLFVNPFLCPPGGGEGVANWMLEALSSRGEVTVLTWDPPDFAEIDAYYGTSLSGKNLKTVTVAPAVRSLLTRAMVPHHLLRVHWLMRRAKQLRPGFRHCFSAFNELDLGPPCLQYIHHPNCPPADWKSPPNPFDSRFITLVWKLYGQVCLRLSGWELSAVQNNLTVSNSRWSGRAYQRLYSSPVHRVIHPPSLGQAPRLTERRNAFLSIGRLSRSKRWPQLVAIIDRVRDLGHDVGLTLVGGRGDDNLLQEMRELKAEGRQWLEIHLDMPRDELDHLIGSHKYGIHGMIEEHYGMAVAELVLGGCLTFVHDSGGQVEIVSQPEARYRSDEDAVEKIHTVLSSEAGQDALAAAQSVIREDITRNGFLKAFHHFLDDLEKGNLEPIDLGDA